MSKIDIIIERLKTAPPEVVDQIYALMETAERQTDLSKAPKRRLSDLFGTLKDSKTFEGDPVARAKPDERQGIMKHYGALKDSKAFAGDPVAIQRAMRDEWT